MLKWMKSWLSFPNAARPKKIDFLIVGLGNPGRAYEKTRHNAGFEAVKCFAKRHSISLRRRENPPVEVGYGCVDKWQVGAVLPLTYMNSSGEVLKAFKVPTDRLMVVVDEIAFPVGVIKLSEKGSHGGHKGLESIAQHLGTTHFPRLRIGIGHPQGKNLADFVLSPFDPEEENKLPDVFNHVADVLECWMLQGIQQAMTQITKRSQ